MKGFVPTPPGVVDLMVGKLFHGSVPGKSARILDPGCGRGAFIDGVIRWCRRHERPLPSITGIESDPRHAEFAALRFAGNRQVEIRHTDFLQASDEQFDYILGNPPYVPITALTTAEREAYRTGYQTARGRFDLYLLFYEQAISMLAHGGRLVFITPEKFLYVDTARPLRNLLRRVDVEELHFLDEKTFANLVTYPLVTSLSTGRPSGETRVLHRDGVRAVVDLTKSDRSWLPHIRGTLRNASELTLGDVCNRISCGVATGADAVFTVRTSQLDDELREFAHPTISGRQILRDAPLRTTHSLLLPYSGDGRLLAETALGALGRHLREPHREAKLRARTCVVRKPWYAFHETPPMSALQRPKILCKDITDSPFFVVDRGGEIIPRHSVYYLVPRDAASLDDLAAYLNSRTAKEWLWNNCQRAANGFVRLQSSVLKRLPMPAAFGELQLEETLATEAVLDPVMA